MITFSNNTKGLALLHQVEEIYGKVYTSDSSPVPRFTGKTRITAKTAEIPERPKNNREILMDASVNCENFY